MVGWRDGCSASGVMRGVEVDDWGRGGDKVWWGGDI